MTITFEQFESVDLRSGIILRVEDFPRAKNPSYKILVDFGSNIGIKQTAAQVTKHYSKDSLIGKLVVGCINLSPRNIAGFMSEFLLVGFADENEDVCLVTVDPVVPLGKKMF